MLDVGTIGSSPSQKTLNEILIKTADPKITNTVTSQWQRAKKQVAKLKKYAQSLTREALRNRRCVGGDFAKKRVHASVVLHRGRL